MSIRIDIAHPDRLFIGGEWVRGTGGTIDVVSAHNEAVIARIAEASGTDVDLAAAAARRAFDEGPWPRLNPQERGGYLRRLSQALEPRMPEIARAWVDQIGALASAAPFVTGGGKFWFDYYADLGEQFDWIRETTRIDGSGRAMVVREPAGVVAAIAPWNNPFGILAGKVAPALMAGCTVVMKPAPETPLEAYILAEAAEAAGLPPGVVNLVCAERFARFTLELGGKSAAIVLEDADIDHTAATLAQVITLSAGQVCATLSRVVAVRSVHERLVEALAAELGKVTVGHPDDPAARMGPLAMRRQRDRVEQYVSDAQAEGATLALGGSRTSGMDAGWYFDPTLFVRVDPSMRIAREEVFGPVLTVLEADDEAAAIAIANDSDFGLYGAVFCADPDRAYRVARAVRTGTVAHNGFLFDPSLPFGGFKMSGIGREGGREGLAAFTELKSLIF